jgi:hypothetical protein
MTGPACQTGNNLLYLLGYTSVFPGNTVENIMISKAAASDKKIYVLLNKGGDPEVKVDSMIWAKSKMTWVPDPDSDEFTFVDMVFARDDHPFENLKVLSNKITLECPNVLKAANEVVWRYTITVEADKNKHPTGETMPPDGDKPVIRN